MLDHAQLLATTLIATGAVLGWTGIQVRKGARWVRELNATIKARPATLETLGALQAAVEDLAAQLAAIRDPHTGRHRAW